MVQLLTVGGDQIDRLEIFEEADMEAALAKFEQLVRPAPQLENAASRADERFRALFAARDWEATADLMADDTSTDDRRPLMGVGVRCGKDTVIADWRATANLGVTNLTSAVIATRGERLVLSRYRFSGRDQRPEAFRTDVLGVVEIDRDQRIAACVMFDIDDIEAAFAELDSRHLRGEAAPYSQTWSVVAGTYAAINRHEFPPTTPDWVNIDHRRATPFAPNDLNAIISTSIDLTPDLRSHAETVHLLSDLGAVVTHVSHGTSHDGFDAEWRFVNLLTVKGDLINRVELFDEDAIDAALARFDELHSEAHRLENAASRVGERFSAYMAAPDWAAMAEMVAEDMCNDDRRPVVNAGLRRGRAAEIANVRTLVNLGVKNTTPVVIATRGERLALGRIRLSGRDMRPEAFHTEVFGVIEIDAQNRIAARVWFDIDDIDAAFAELDARYLAGEAATHAQTWSLIARAYATLNRHELPPVTPDFVNIDHRRGGSAFAAGDLLAYVRASWDDSPDNKIYIEAVHRLSNVGAVVTSGTRGASIAGFNAEWREIGVVTVDGDMLNRTELFDEADLDVALARFDELDRPAP
jgi:hypothetical protein